MLWASARSGRGEAPSSPWTLEAREPDAGGVGEMGEDGVREMGEDGVREMGGDGASPLPERANFT